MEFNKQYWIEQLKKEVGLMEVPYDQLAKHDVELASPTGRSTGFRVNAKVYVDQQLKIIEEDYNKFEETAKAEQALPVDITVSEQKPDLVPIAPTPLKVENIRFFDVNINNVLFTVIINDDKSPDAVDHLNLIFDRRFFIKERKREDMLGTETIISIYQYINAIADIPREQVPFSAFEMITQNMETVFDGLKLKGII